MSDGAVPSDARRSLLSGPTCTDEVCLTCSDEAIPVRVVELLPEGLARVDTGTSVEEVSVALVDAAIGDTILVHAGEAIGVLRGGP